MTTTLTTIPTLPIAAEPLSDSAQGYLRADRADNTKRAYQSAMMAFVEWCQAQGRAALPATAATVADYVAHLADRGLAAPSIQQALAAIVHVHRRAGVKDADWEPARAVLAGIRRTQRHAAKEAPPLMAADLRRIIEAME